MIISSTRQSRNYIEHIPILTVNVCLEAAVRRTFSFKPTPPKIRP